MRRRSSLEFIGINELASVRFVSNLTSKWCCMFENRGFHTNETLGGICLLIVFQVWNEDNLFS